MPVYLWNIHKSHMTFNQAIMSQNVHMVSLRIAQGADKVFYACSVGYIRCPPLYRLLCSCLINKKTIPILHVLLDAGTDTSTVQSDWLDNSPSILMVFLQYKRCPQSILNNAFFWGYAKTLSIILTFSTMTPMVSYYSRNTTGLYHSFRRKICP